MNVQYSGLQTFKQNEKPFLIITPGDFCKGATLELNQFHKTGDPYHTAYGVHECLQHVPLPSWTGGPILSKLLN